VTADDLTVGAPAVGRPQAQPSGWRRLFGAFGGGGADELSAEEREQEKLLAQVKTPLPDGHRLAVISLKGGVGKTTATAVLGATLASMRIDRVVAIDANPDRGTLADKVQRTTQATVRDLITDRRSIGRYATLQRYVNRTPSRLEVLASEADPAASHAFDEADYAAALDMLERFYNIILTDCGTGLLHAATRAALANADSVVVVSSSSLDGARSASATLDWLEAHGREDLARNAVAVVNEVREGVDELDVDRIEEHFASRCRAVQRVPYDSHLAAGTVIDPDQLAPETRDAYTRIAASVVCGAAIGECPPQ
jgi:MinD-like ATPase involved in chromosome partitioning or flagellar assembly